MLRGSKGAVSLGKFHPPHPTSPVLVEASPALVADVLGKYGFEVPQPAGGFDVAHQADHHYRGGVNDGDSFHLLPLRNL